LLVDNAKSREESRVWRFIGSLVPEFSFFPKHSLAETRPEIRTSQFKFALTIIVVISLGWLGALLRWSGLLLFPTSVSEDVSRKLLYATALALLGLVIPLVTHVKLFNFQVLIRLARCCNFLSGLYFLYSLKFFFPRFVPILQPIAFLIGIGYLFPRRYTTVGDILIDLLILGLYLKLSWLL
jgi:hypothetical protein